MGTLIVTPHPKRPVIDEIFEGITDSTFTYQINSVDEYEWVFDEDLTEDQVREIARRCSMSVEKEEIFDSAVQAYETLSDFAEFQGDANAQQLTFAVKTMAGIVAGLIKVVYDKMD